MYLDGLSEAHIVCQKAPQALVVPVEYVLNRLERVGEHEAHPLFLILQWTKSNTSERLRTSPTQQQAQHNAVVRAAFCADAIIASIHSRSTTH
jgi:hypothetical protein